MHRQNSNEPTANAQPVEVAFLMFSYRIVQAELLHIQLKYFIMSKNSLKKRR